MGGENRGHGSMEISASVATENVSSTDRVETSQMLSWINPEASEKHMSTSIEACKSGEPCNIADHVSEENVVERTS